MEIATDTEKTIINTIHAAQNLSGRGISIEELSKALDIPREKLTGIAENLERDGIVRKDFSDGRNVLVLSPDAALRLGHGTNGAPPSAISPFEAEVLKIAQEQLTNGTHGGNFTPGFVRRETGKGYNSINGALGSLAAVGLLERGKHVAQRDGQPVEVALYKITNRGVDALEKIRAGAIKVEERPQPVVRHANHRTEAPPLLRDDVGSAAIPRLESHIKTLSMNLDSLNSKVDRLLILLAGSQRATPGVVVQRRAPGIERGSREKVREATRHKLLMLYALRHLTGNGRPVMAIELQTMYEELCQRRKMECRSASQFRNILARLEESQYINQRSVGCKALGIKNGHGSRLILELTPQGAEFLGRNEEAIAPPASPEDG
ncbi:MAG: hypothetical protein HZB92_03890 [Euryarchaeota archaeon]|nr:hypothetical protein [Euryarchaeota archaeon]